MANHRRLPTTPAKHAGKPDYAYAVAVISICALVLTAIVAALIQVP